jgi:hypothetical protein
MPVVVDDRRLVRGATLRGNLSSFLEWPRGVARFGVVLCVAVALAYGLVYAVRAIDHLGQDARKNAALNYDDREFAGGNSLVVDKGALYEARALIPENETYRVVAGPGVTGATELTEPYIDQYVRSFLMPRRPSADARWIICYGCDVASLGEGFTVLWQDDFGILLGRLPT